MARNNHKSRRKGPKNPSSYKHPTGLPSGVGPRSVAFVAKHGPVYGAIHTSEANQSGLWTRAINHAPEHHSPETSRKVSPLIAQNWHDQRRRWESESLRGLPTTAAVVWDTKARRRAEKRRGKKFMTPKRR